MTVVRFKVKNEFNWGERKILVYNSFNNSYCFLPNNEGGEIIKAKEFDIPLPEQHQLNFLKISEAPGANYLVEPFQVKLPFDPDLIVTLKASGTGNITINQSGTEMLFIIPKGPPGWQLKIARPNKNPSGISTGDTLTDTEVTVSNHEVSFSEPPPNSSGGSEGP